MTKLIFVTGGSASGKTTIAQNIKNALKEDAVLISQDMFYKPTGNPETNYDVPEAFDWELQRKVFEDLQAGKEVEVPIYSFEKHDRIGTTTIKPTEVIVFEGLFTFWDDELAKLSHFQIFVDTPSDTRLARRLLRDVRERGRDPIDVIERWEKDVQPSFLKYINVMKSRADIIVPWTKVKERAVSALLSAIRGYKMTGDTLMDTLLIIAAALGLVVLISGLGLTFMWIKYSWIRRENSANYTGQSITEKLFANNGVSARVKTKWIYLKFWNHNKRKDTHALRPWTANRRSLWTMMEASQQAYSTIIREKNPKTFWIAFRLPKIISFVGGIIGAAFIGWGVYALNDLDKFNVKQWQAIVSICIGFSIVVTAMLYLIVYRAYVLKRDVPKMLEGTNLTMDEIDVIRRIFTWALVYAIGNAILQTIKLAIDILEKTQKGQR